jgi:hypothetical protein
MLHKQALASRNVSLELKTGFQAVIRVVNYAKKQSIKRRYFAKLYDDVEVEHMALLYYCERW